MNSQVMKPCPFCGSDEIMDMQHDGDFWAQCSGCNCSTQVYEFESEAHAAWNTRATPAPTPDHLPDATKMVEAVEVVGVRISTDGFGSYIADSAMGIGAAQPGEVREPLMTVAQHNRIVSALQSSHSEDVRAMVADPSPAGVDGLEVVSNWVLFNAEADTPYIKKMLPEGFLAFFDCEEDARRAKANNPGTDYKRIDRVKAEDAQRIIDGQRGENEALQAQVKVLQSDADQQSDPRLSAALRARYISEVTP